MPKLPKLYKLTSKNKIQCWQIWIEGNKIITVQGQLKGKEQRYEEIIKKGKNIGRSNETTPEQQAKKESKSRWDKKFNKDYRLTIEACDQKDKRANVGGYLPMLAHDYHKHAKKYLKYPCYVQPKFDGLRCIATKEDDKVKLWFRSGKEITTMCHIAEELNKLIQNGVILDGELYAHGKDFNKFTGAIRANKNLNPEIVKQIKYYIYDVPRTGRFTEKDTYHERFLYPFLCGLDRDCVQIAGTFKIDSFEEAMEFYERFINEGYEGIIFRNANMPYEQKRSYNLLKYKEFIDDEFIIIGAEEGKGTLAGHVGSFICKIEPGRVLQDIGGKEITFGDAEGIIKAKMKGKTEYLKTLFNSPEKYLGKPLTIKYQNLSIDGIPRFPVALSIRFDI